MPPRSKQQQQRKPSRRARAHVPAIDSYDDTLDPAGADEFHKNRDKVLLDDTSNTSRLRNALTEQAGDAFFDEDEVFAPTYDGPGSDDDDGDGDEGAADGEGEGQQRAKKERKRVLKERAAKGQADAPKGRFAKPDPTSSDDDDDDDGSDASDDAADSDSEEDDDDETWGANPSAYYARPSARRGRDDEDTDSDDEALAERRMLEEKEVRLQQRKAREGMGRGDWGLDDVEAVAETEEVKEAEPAAPAVPLPTSTDPAALLAHLARHAPEALALAREWPDVIKRLPVLAKAIEEKVQEDPEYKGLGMMALHYQTYLAYTTTLAFYFRLAALPATERPDLQQHPVLNRLLQLKEALGQMEDLDFAGDGDDDGESDPDEFAHDHRAGMFDDDEDDSADDDDDDDDAPLDLTGALDGKRDAAAERAWRQQMLEGLDEGELEALLEEMAAMKANGGRLPDDDDDEDDEDDDLGAGSDDLADGMDDEDAVPAPPPPAAAAKKAKSKKAAKAGKQPTAVAFPTIAEPTPSFAPQARNKAGKKTAAAAASAGAADDDALAEPTALSAPDDAAKAAARHSLRFHAQKIESAAARRASARAGRMGGDDDVPYRNKQAGRDAALRKNSAAALAQRAGDDDLDGEEWGEADLAAARAVRAMDAAGADGAAGDSDDGGDAGEGDDGYYQLVKKRKREEKEEKQAAYDEAREEERYVEDESTDGPRSLTRAILKNKGLTPIRSKSVRNPRVKKRMRFDKAKKQVASRQAVYAGGQGALKGSYGGEATGISQVVKSRKF